MDDHGLDLLELEFLMDWFFDPGDERRSESDRTARAAVGGRRRARRPITSRSATSPARPATIDQLTRAVRRAVRRRRRATTTRRSSTSSCRSTSTSRISTRRSRSSTAPARPNGGLAIDTWHMSQARHRARRAAPRSRSSTCSWVELTDGRSRDMPDPVDETINHRLLPGEGEFDVRGYVDACRDAGYARPVGGRGALRGAARAARSRRSSGARVREQPPPNVP